MMIRQAGVQDVHAIWQLNSEVLGYPYPYEATKKQLEKLLKDDHHFLLVAEMDHAVVGYVHAQDYEVLYAPKMKDILGIAVAPALQHQHIGSALLTQLAQIARQQGCESIRLVSGASRIQAHQFYEQNGYERKKEQLNFRKTL